MTARRPARCLTLSAWPAVPETCAGAPGVRRPALHAHVAAAVGLLEASPGLRRQAD